MFTHLQNQYEKEKKFFGDDKFAGAAKQAGLSEYAINLYKELYSQAVKNYKNEEGYRYPVTTFGMNGDLPEQDPFVQGLKELMDTQFIYHFVEGPAHFVIFTYFNFSLFDPEETDRAIHNFTIKMLQDANIPMVVEGDDASFENIKNH